MEEHKIWNVLLRLFSCLSETQYQLIAMQFLLSILGMLSIELRPYQFNVESLFLLGLGAHAAGCNVSGCNVSAIIWKSLFSDILSHLYSFKILNLVPAQQWDRMNFKKVCRLFLEISKLNKFEMKKEVLTLES